MNVYRDIKAVLTEGGMAEGEAKAVALLLMEKVAGMTTTEALTGDPKGEPHRTTLLHMAQRATQGEPVQYILGQADFCGLTLKVAPGVLIPRPETEELVEWVVESVGRPDFLENPETPEPPSPLRLLDIGTGSGCIAIALAKRLPQAQVEAWDVSEAALRIAQENAQRSGVHIHFRLRDVLHPTAPSPSAAPSNPSTPSTPSTPFTPLNPFSPSPHIIISNPPYICEDEAPDMESNVLSHEPHLALFVPNNDPLLFYRHIAALAMGSLENPECPEYPEQPALLSPHGLLFFEVNRRFAHDVVRLLEQMGYQDVELRQDQFGNDRMVKAIKP